MLKLPRGATDIQDVKLPALPQPEALVDHFYVSGKGPDSEGVLPEKGRIFGGFIARHDDAGAHPGIKISQPAAPAFRELIEQLMVAR